MQPNWQNRTIALLMACAVIIALAASSFGNSHDATDFAPSFLQFKAW